MGLDTLAPASGAQDMRTPGATFGAESVSLTAEQNGPHAHSGIPQVSSVGRASGNPTAARIDSQSGGSTDSSGASAPHQNLPPEIVVNFIVRALP